jgi:hypothetical protein
MNEYLQRLLSDIAWKELIVAWQRDHRWSDVSRIPGGKQFWFCPYEDVAYIDFDGSRYLLKGKISKKRYDKLIRDPETWLTDREMRLWRKAKCKFISSTFRGYIAYAIPVSRFPGRVQGYALILRKLGRRDLFPKLVYDIFPTINDAKEYMRENGAYSLPNYELALELADL